MLALRIATLNCLDLALPSRRFYDGIEPYSADEYIAKTQWLAQMLDRLSADFVLVQEVFHRAALEDVVRQSVGGSRGWSFSVPFSEESNDKPRLGLIWRSAWQPQIDSIVQFAPGDVVTIPERGPHDAFSRPLLRARVSWPPGVTLTLFNVHLKSRRPEFAASESRDDAAAEARAQLRSLLMRAAEAAALRKLLVQATLKSRAPLVVAGDFNDEATAVTTQMVADTSWKYEDRSGRDCTLFNVLDVEQRAYPGRSRDVAFTILHAGEPERIDHVLVSEEFVRGSKYAIGRVAAVEIFNDHLTERRARGRPAGSADLMRIYSDHAAVCVTLEVNAA